MSRIVVGHQEIKALHVNSHITCSFLNGSSQISIREVHTQWEIVKMDRYAGIISIEICATKRH